MKSRQFRRYIYAAAAAVLLSAAPLSATTYIWAGGGGAANPNWSNPNNWVSGISPASSASTDIIFGNAGAAYFPVQDAGSPFSLRSLSFDMSGYSLAIDSLYFPTAGFLHFNASFSQITTPHPTTSMEITSDLTIDGNGNAAINALIRGVATLASSRPALALSH
jgi:hypothetical protein